MDLRLFREATNSYHKSASTIFQVSTNLWVGNCEEIALPKATLENNVKAMIEIKQVLPEMFHTQVNNLSFPRFIHSIRIIKFIILANDSTGSTVA